MTEEFYVGVYWMGRRESAEACARRAETCFRGLASCDALYARWFETADSLDEALRRQFEPDAATLLRLFTRKARINIEDWYSLRVWNGAIDEASCSLSLTCGTASEWVSNACVLSLPSSGPAADRLLCTHHLTRVLSAMAVAWAPEWGVVTSDECRQRLSEDGEAGTFVGWIMYFSRSRGEVAPLPAPVHVEPVEDKGTLVVLTPERFTTNNPVHVELAREVSDRLSRAGLLGPLRAGS